MASREPPQDDSENAGRWEPVLSPRAWLRHLVWLLASIASGFGGLYFTYVENYSVRFTHYVQAVNPLIPAAIVAVSMVIICRLRDKYFRGTDGTGIPQAIAGLKIPEGTERHEVLSYRIAVGKLLLLTIGLFSGATIGREGPSVHVGACFMYLSSKIVRFPEHLVRRGLILAGGAAGIAAAFNAPIAGLVFAMEEIGRSFEKDNAGTIVRTVAVACILGIIPLGDHFFYGRVTVGLGSLAQWATLPAIGLLGGLLGGLFAQAVAYTSPRIGRASRRRPYLVAGLLGLALAALGLLSQGQSYGSGYDQAKQILIEGQAVPVFYAFVKAAASFVSLISGIPGGLFDPSLSVGTALGQLSLPLLPHIDPQAAILMAMAAYFAGVVQSPITVSVILLEMTAAHGMALPLMATSILAYEMSHLVCPTSLYESLANSFLAAKIGAPELAVPRPPAEGSEE